MFFTRVRLLLKQVPLVGTTLIWLRDTTRLIFGPKRLKKQVNEAVAQGKPIRIILGAGFAPVDSGWIPTNMPFLNLLVDEHWSQAFGQNKLDAILAEHVWEHLTPTDAKAAAEQCFKYLKSGGTLRIAVPDGNHPDPEYIEFVKPGGWGCGSDDHKLLYTFNTICDMLESAGFTTELLEYYDANGSFHRVPWDSSRGRIDRCHGHTEKNLKGDPMPYTSLIVDAKKP